MISSYGWASKASSKGTDICPVVSEGAAGAVLGIAARTVAPVDSAAD